MSTPRFPFRWLATFAVACAFATPAAAQLTWQMEQIFSDLDGTLQFVVLHEYSGKSGQNGLKGSQFTSLHTEPGHAHDPGTVTSYTFPSDLPSSDTAGRRFLIATQGFADLGILTPDYIIENGFIPIGAGNLNFFLSNSIIYDAIGYSKLPSDGVNSIYRDGGVIKQNLATNFAGQSASVGTAAPPAVYGNFQGLWWASPPGSESGWGINLNHQGTTIFATCFTFGLDGKPLWMVVSATSTAGAPNTFAGDLYSGTGPPFNAFDPAAVVANKVGTATFTFTGPTTAAFAYNVGGVAQTKQITREVFGTSVPSCTFGAQPDLAAATNYQDIWWNAPASSEPGWGINLTHQGDTIFASWFTFGLDGKPMWLVVAANRTTANVYTGTLTRAVSGPPFNAVPFDPAQVSGMPAGTATLTFTDGNNASFSYSVDGVAQTKQITREVFAAPGTVCQ